MDQTKVVDHLAAHDDRYLAIVAVVLLISGGFLAIKYLVGHLRHLQTKGEAQTERLIEVAADCRNTSAACRQCIENNTEVLRRVDSRLESYERNL